MKHILLRISLIVIVLACLLGVQPGGVTHAGTIPHAWASRSPVLDGAIGNGEWTGAASLAFTNYSVSWQNDAQFLYLAFDVFGDNPSTPSPIGSNENFVVGIDVNQSGTATSGVDLAYKLNTSTAGNPLWKQTSMGVGAWSVGAASPSYAEPGFGKTPGHATAHRVYEAAIRLSEIDALPGGTVLAGFTVYSASPSFTENEPGVNAFANYYTLGLAPIQVAFIYNTAGGLTDANAFHDFLADYGGFQADLIYLGNVATVDFSNYQAIIVGHDTGSSNALTWLGSDAARDKIEASGEPVLGIGNGGVALFGSMGLDLNETNSATFSDSSTDSLQRANDSEHPAWYAPYALSSSGKMYSSAVTMRTIDWGSLTAPALRITELAHHYNDSDHMLIAGEMKNGVCYTLWGWYSHPELLNSNGKELFANILTNPVCMPKVLYIGLTSDTALNNAMQSMFNLAGFGANVYGVTTTQTIGFNVSWFDVVVAGKDTKDVWDQQVNVDAVRESGLPVVGIGEGGDYLLVALGASIDGFHRKSVGPEKQADIVNPLQPALRAPYVVPVDSTLTTDIDFSLAGVTEWALNARSPNLIGKMAGIASYPTILTEAYNNTCYTLWGFEDDPAYLTSNAESLLRNLVAAPHCTYSQFMPLTRK